MTEDIHVKLRSQLYIYTLYDTHFKSDMMNVEFSTFNVTVHQCLIILFDTMYRHSRKLEEILEERKASKSRTCNQESLFGRTNISGNLPHPWCTQYNIVSLCHPIFITLSTLAAYASVEHTGNSIDFLPMAAVAVSRFGSPHHEGIPDYLAHRSRARSDSFHVTVERESTLRNIKIPLISFMATWNT